MKTFKTISISLLSILLILIIWQYGMVVYGLNQLRGQLHIVWNARPVNDILKDVSVSDTVKNKLLLIQDIRNFAFDSLGINHSNNYTSMYDQKGKPVLWVITAAEPYEMKAYKWKFPFIGSFSYKGFFEQEKAEKEQNKLKEEGYDTDMGPVNGWSTLGWFKDPVLSMMLRRSEGDLANLIIHELTHGTLYVKDSVKFNENLATFVGNVGAELFLISKYGPTSSQLADYIDRMEDREKYAIHILKGADRLDSLYNTFTEKLSVARKDQLKYQLIKEIVESIDTINFNNKTAYLSIFEDEMPNNTYFMSYRRYHADLKEIEQEYREKFGSDFKEYFDYLKVTFPSL